MSKIDIMTKNINNIDKQVGINIKTIRKATGLTQGELGRQIGISAQQINKYEAGIDRISVSMLYKIATILHCDIDILSQTQEKTNTTNKTLKVAEESAVYQANNKPVNSNALELLKLFFKMSKEEQSALIQKLKNKVEKK